MAIIKFSKEEKDHIIPLIQNYLKEELDCETGRFDAEFLLDFFSKHIGGYIYNRALTDAHAQLDNQLALLAESIDGLEKQVPSIRKK